jgi:hypothetical protein
VAHRATDRIPRELNSDTRSPKNGPPHDHTTGFKKDDIIELCALIHTADRDGSPPILGLFNPLWLR